MSTGLAEFIETERAKIVAEWEVFARTLLPAARPLDARALRDHADEILTAIVQDMRSRQSTTEQAEKSKGRGEARRLGYIGQLHAALRLESGFKLGQIVAEYRALRASVFRLWDRTAGADREGVTRFNEAIDEALSEAVDEFMETTEHYREQSLGILGHDLRNPLTGIIAGATLLMSAHDVSDRNVRIAARILSSGNRMNRMIGDLLDLTRTRFGDAIPIVRAPTDLDPIVQQVVAELEGSHAGGLRASTEGDLRGEWDGDRIAQLLSNLVRNAIQHGAASTPIDVAAVGDGDKVVVSIHNSGPPIPPAVLGTIFEPMVRHAQADSKRSVGLGLGLYIASQIAAAHGATIDVTSTAEGGTTFTVRLPRRAVPKATTRAAAAPALNGTAH